MKESITQLHHMCEDWKRELKFFKDEIEILRNRLDEVAARNTSNEVMVDVEHYENKFKILSIHIDELMHDLNIKTDEITSNAASQSKYINVKMFDADTKLADLMLITSKDFHETKNKFYGFLTKVF